MSSNLEIMSLNAKWNDMTCNRLLMSRQQGRTRRDIHQVLSVPLHLILEPQLLLAS